MIASILGWIGAAIYLVAYVLLTLDFLAAGSIYLMLNVLAASLVMVVSVDKASWAAFFINGAWSIVSLYSWAGGSLSLSQFMLPLTRWGIGTAFLPVIVLFCSGKISNALSILAWCSFLSYILPYVLFLGHKIGRNEFHFWNLLAATVIIPSLFVDQNWPVIAIQVFWMGVSSFGLLQKVTWRIR